LSFTLKGEKEEAVRLVDNLNLVSHLANVGDSRTLIIQPSATTHQQLSPEEQEAAGVTPTQLRVSVGLEHIEDIIRDFTQAFDKLSLTK
jgi:O-acetylhomoserine (thiol)-lyase